MVVIGNSSLTALKIEAVSSLKMLVTNYQLHVFHKTIIYLNNAVRTSNKKNVKLFEIVNMLQTTTTIITTTTTT